MQAVTLYFAGFILFTGGICVKVHDNFGVGIWTSICGILVWGLVVLSWSYYGEIE